MGQEENAVAKLTNPDQIQVGCWMSECCYLDLYQVVTEEDKAWILGKSLYRLIEERQRA